MELGLVAFATSPALPDSPRHGGALVTKLAYSTHSLCLPASSLYRESHRYSCAARLQTFCCTGAATTVKPSVQNFCGLGDLEGPVLLCETRTLQSVISLSDARNALISAVAALQSNPPRVSSGIIRFQVALSAEVKALPWLQAQPYGEELWPRIYFSTRGQCGEGSDEEDLDALKNVAGIGSAVVFKGQNSLTSRDLKCFKRFLSRDSPLIRAYGAIRFNADIEPSEEWKPFGSFYFSIPQVELCESSSCPILAVTVAWDEALGRSFDGALNATKRTLFQCRDHAITTNRSLLLQNLLKEHTPSERAWHGLMKDVLEVLDTNDSNQSASQHLLIKRAFRDAIGLSKVVLARKTKLEVDAVLEPLTLLSILQGRDPNAYQFCIQLANRSSFIGNTPERLFYKDGVKVFSEAVAATRAHGITEMKDYESSIELLLSTKDHTEFDIVMESVKQRLEVVCKDVRVQSYKSLIKQANIQHLYGRLVGQLRNGNSEFELLTELHPTPAVCGQPQNLAKKFLSETEEFDRGMYSGPVGWISGDKAEFAVAIRSSLLEDLPFRASHNGASGTRLSLFAGVGIVKGAKSSSEWKELDLKIRQFEAILQPFSPLEDAVNINALWARLVIEECCRLGISYFCIAPGSRSSPLAVAAAENHKANCVSCVDERSLAFHALGYGRGASKPAAVITSSGTAVSNLLPAVVEANEDCVPLVLLTADRPPELLQAGANQTIDQVKHFGSFVRYQTNLPPPSDEIQARMVLTTIDAAVFKATSSPKGAVHINIAFREPLAATPYAWNPVCLKGLERWVSHSQPFTRYITPVAKNIRQHDFLCGEVKEISDIITSTSRGLLLVGGLQKAEDSRAVLLLAKHLGWPVVPDILSGIRLRHFNLVNEDERLCILDFFDHVLLNRELYDSIKPDVVLQIGSRLTSKRLAMFLETCQPSPYILVEEHPFRHDPSHLLTHRVHGSVIEFVTQLVLCSAPSQSRGYGKQLMLLSDVVGQEITFQLESESTISEPHVARIVASSLTLDTALFVGNSMPVRDADMYCEGLVASPSNELGALQAVPGTSVRTAGNRGASGIDGVLSTAVGFAAGSGQQVTLLIGDVSFLHDTNGLLLLTKRAGQPPIVVVVINNSGGGIFSLLPIANTASEAAFTNFFTTPHDVSLRQLCLAHRINHTLVQSKQQLLESLKFVQKQKLNWVIEVTSSVDENAEYHRHLQVTAKQAIRQALQVVHRAGVFGQGFKTWTIKEALYHPYRFQMAARPTTSIRTETSNLGFRQGFIFCLHLHDGSSGYGEVAPLEGLHKENLQDVEEQLRLLVHLLQEVTVSNTLALLNGFFANWLSKSLGVMPETLFPSVRCGLEMAILGALASANQCSFADLLNGHTGLQNSKQHEAQDSSQEVHQTTRICGLLDSYGTPAEMASSALQLVQQGFCTLKIKVARRVSPSEDAAILLAIREKVGPKIHLRADANQRWTLAQALEFANAVRSCGLQYLEEPVKSPDDLLKFCNETGFPVAIDESLDKNTENVSEAFSHLGLAAAIIKPSSVGGFERAALIAKWAQKKGMLAVISCAFESSISLAAYAQFSSFVDERRIDSITASDMDRKRTNTNIMIPPVAHGLGTYMWLANDVICGNRFSVKPSDGVEALIEECAATLKNVVLNEETVQVGPCVATIHSKTYTINSATGKLGFHVLETQDYTEKNMELPVLVFFHGFLGTSRDWVPVMQALSISNRCISVDLPGHGKTSIIEHKVSNLETVNGFTQVNPFSMENVAEALNALLVEISAKKVTLVGYSMGARLALYMSLRCNKQVCGAVIISGSPGLQKPAEKKERAGQDHGLAVTLQQTGLKCFLDSWYQKPMWKSLRRHPRFTTLTGTRVQHQDVESLARALSSMSVGRQPSLWKDLADPPVPLLLVAGKNDEKFIKIARKMYGDTGATRLTTETTMEESSSGGIQSRILDQGRTDHVVDRQLAHDSHQNKRANEEESNRFLLEEALVLQTDKQEDVGETGRRKFMNLLELENTGHAVHIENPFLLVNGISKFVSRLMKTSVED
ncbi:hypothetical protein GOP47_0029246 [Adiantum capillus-veneris]|nr:hypothetical protein GOP47_0029246 [Adiantum capillus-veneris]